MNFMKKVFFVSVCSSALFFQTAQAMYIDSETGIWVGEVDHFCDVPLANALVSFFKTVQADSIVDFGC